MEAYISPSAAHVDVAKTFLVATIITSEYAHATLPPETVLLPSTAVSARLKVMGS